MSYDAFCKLPFNAKIISGRWGAYSRINWATTVYYIQEEIKYEFIFCGFLDKNKEYPKREEISLNAPELTALIYIWFYFIGTGDKDVYMKKLKMLNKKANALGISEKVIVDKKSIVHGNGYKTMAAGICAYEEQTNPYL